MWIINFIIYRQPWRKTYYTISKKQSLICLYSRLPHRGTKDDELLRYFAMFLKVTCHLYNSSKPDCNHVPLGQIRTFHMEAEFSLKILVYFFVYLKTMKQRQLPLTPRSPMPEQLCTISISALIGNALPDVTLSLCFLLLLLLIFVQWPRGQMARSLRLPTASWGFPMDCDKSGIDNSSCSFIICPYKYAGILHFVLPSIQLPQPIKFCQWISTSHHKEKHH